MKKMMMLAAMAAVIVAAGGCYSPKYVSTVKHHVWSAGLELDWQARKDGTMLTCVDYTNEALRRLWLRDIEAGAVYTRNAAGIEHVLVWVLDPESGRRMWIEPQKHTLYGYDAPEGMLFYTPVGVGAQRTLLDAYVVRGHSRDW